MNTVKQQVRAETEDLVAQYLAKGGRVDRAPRFESGNGYTGKDWARAERGLKVATQAEIKAERERRTLAAINAKNVKLALDLLNFRFDKEIRFDIENDRLGPNGEIR